MPSIAGLLSSSRAVIGTISAVVGDGMYRVTHNGRSSVVIGGDVGLAVGGRVLFLPSQDGNMFIRSIGTSEGDVTVVQLDV